MSNIKKLMMSAAGGDALDVDEVFSTYLYDGNSSTQTITNGIDLDGEGGLVWIKCRDSGQEHNLYDTERGVYKFLQSQSNVEEDQNVPKGLTAFNSNGFSLDVGNESGSSFNNSSFDYVSWTFRKAPKFFDVVTYAGDSNSSRVISHNLGSAVGMIIIKTLNSNDSWNVFHRGLDNGLGTGRLFLDNTNSVDNNTLQFLSADSSSVTFANNAAGNYSGNDYVMYLFAHNDGDGGFGPDGDQDIIKCGSVTLTSGFTDVNLGFEPQFVIIKKINGAQDWFMHDSMRGLPYDGYSILKANTSAAEFSSTTTTPVRLTPTGMEVNVNYFGSGDFAYIAIRRGSLFQPESGTDVFAMDFGGQTSPTPPLWSAGFNPDFALERQGYQTATDNFIVSRLTQGKILVSNNAFAEINDTNWPWFDVQNGVSKFGYSKPSWYAAMWRRAPGFFDVVCYTGDGTTNQTFNHGLTVEPGMIWLKNRKRGSTDWYCWVDDSITTLEGRLNTADDFGANVIGTVTDTSVQTLNTNQYATNYNGDSYIAYLFATLPGISKCGSYTGDGTSNSSKVIDCGFSSGARFVIIKSVDGEANNWFMFDTLRGIAAGNDSVLKIDRTNAANSNADYIDPHNSGFIVGAASNTVNAVNVSGVKYMFYAIA